jgi:S-adenosylmethionine:tRNA-ribosyltransferase-isomerase (queuine synthetase)
MALIRPFKDEAARFIAPGYRFRAVAVVTINFRLSRSTRSGRW